ncbi:MULTISPECIES: hypothetical protein [Trichocoleus]|uniref:Uncharacterized protein n=1 Tax=Trichocoleus desertorum GB2-A4 TaxID=2933944 RepID=A0ABV0J558_9CYAN|nr:hypothetical protein [Trichocoleus sp. FACHB-46]MBD1863753.1 hypothetical protein [Trichocoleus sp. FACHB-46]
MKRQAKTHNSSRLSQGLATTANWLQDDHRDFGKLKSLWSRTHPRSPLQVLTKFSPLHLRSPSAG